MRRRLNLEEEAAALQERYQPAYIEAFLENRQYPDQTIEEWTSAQGSQHYGVHQIYKPLSISVSISGPTDNHFAVDCSKVDWHPRLVSAVKNSLIEARRATDGDTVTLCDVTGVPFTTEMSGAAMRNAGVIYPIVNGKRLIRSPLIGQEMQVQTPVAYQSNKEARLANWSQGVAQKAVTVIASAANGAVDASNVDQRLFSAETVQKVKQLVEKEISVVGEHFADDSASLEEISAAVSDTIMGAVEQAYQKRSSDVVAFFRHQQAISQRSPSLSSSSQQSQQQASRSIFSAGAKSEKERAEQQLVQSSISRAIEVRYPTQLSLHKDILSPLASSDQALYSAIGHCLCAPSRNRMRGVGGGGRQRRKQPAISITTTTVNTPVSVAGSVAGAVAGSVAGAVAGNSVAPQEKRIGAPVDHLASFRTMLGDDQYIRAIASKNALAGVPLSPGFALVECHNDGKKKKEMATARRRGLLVESEYMDPTKGRASLLDQLGESESSVAVAAAPLSASKRVMPGLEPSNAPVSRQMPALDKTVPVSATASVSGRKMPGLETVPTMSVSSSPVAVPVSRQMPSLEAAPIKSAMPGLETFSAVPVAVASAPASVATTTVAAQRIKHTPAKQLPQINN